MSDRAAGAWLGRPWLAALVAALLIANGFAFGAPRMRLAANRPYLVSQAVAEARTPYGVTSISMGDVFELIKQLESDMKAAAKNLEFERAAMIRDRIIELRKGEDLVSL